MNDGWNDKHRITIGKNEITKNTRQHGERSTPAAHLVRGHSVRNRFIANPSRCSRVIRSRATTSTCVLEER
jgi:hypothetical protein